MPRGLFIVALFVVQGCSNGVDAPPASNANPNGTEQSAESAEDASEDAFTHVIAADTEYYTTGPQQGRPPDGEFKEGTKVTLLEEAGSYSLVRSEDGIEAYVATDALNEAADAQPTKEEREAAEANNHFALDLYAQLAQQEQGNLFFSPFNISTALAMTYAGAEGQTEAQMAEVLRFSLPEEQLHPAVAALVKRLHTEDEGLGYRLLVANRLWGQEGHDFRPEFLDLTRVHYGAELAKVDFVRQAEDARQEINAWVEEQTQDKITDLMPQGAVDEMTRLVLTGAIYFKGDWTSPFDPELTAEAPFHVGAGEEVAAPLMHQTDDFGYRQAEGLQILDLPYGQKDLSMVVLLPAEADGLAELEKSLTLEDLVKWLDDLPSEKVEVFLPKFKLEQRIVLNEVLQTLGMTLAFDPGQADFSGISSSEELFISAAIHKAYVDVNEEGTEAAAATGIAVGATSFQEPAVFRADHPFIFLIRDNRTGAILFLGRFVKPT